MAGLPIVDLSPLTSGAIGADEAMAHDIGAALRTWGAFAVVGHGVPQRTIDAAFAAARQFFLEPLDARLSLKVNKHNRGYVPLQQTVYEGNLPDLKESFNLGFPLSPDDPDILSGKPLHGVNVWPDLQGFRVDVERYFEAILSLGNQLLAPMALCLNMRESELRALYNRPIAFMRLFHYPPNGRVGVREHGAAEHQDYGFLTILAQDSLGGLQVRSPEGEIVDVEPRSDAFIVNAGDMLSRITSGAIRSAPHRVINSAGQGRYSIPMFYDPNFDARFPGMPDVSAGEFLLAKFNRFYLHRKERGGSN